MSRRIALSRRARTALVAAAFAGVPVLAHQVEAPRKPAAATDPAAQPTETSAAAPSAKPAAPRPAFVKDRYRIEAPGLHARQRAAASSCTRTTAVPIVAVNLWYHVGSRNEKPGKTGFAHLFEHFFFNGSENYPHGFREAMDDLGATNRNGTTNTDRTNFFENVPTSALERTLYLEADRMGFLAGAHLEGDARARARRGAEREAPGREPALRPRRSSNLAPNDLSDVASLLLVDDRQHGRPRRRVARRREGVVPHLLRPEQLRARRSPATSRPSARCELVKKYFGGIPPGPPLRRAEQWIPRFERNIRDEACRTACRRRVYRAWHAPGWHDADLHAARALRRRAQRLEERAARSPPGLREDAGDRRRAPASTSARSPACFRSQATVKPGVDPAAVEREIDAVLQALHRQMARRAAELQRAQSRSARRLRPQHRARSAASAAAPTCSPRAMTYRRQRRTPISTASSAWRRPRRRRCKAAAARWLDAPHYTMVVRPSPSSRRGKTTLDRTPLPPLGAAPDGDLPRRPARHADERPVVVLLERHSTPIVNLALAVDAGYAADEPAEGRPRRAGAATCSTTARRRATPSQIVDELDALGARLTTRSSLDLSFVQLQALPATARRRRSTSWPTSSCTRRSRPIMVALQKQRPVAQIGAGEGRPAQRWRCACCRGCSTATATPTASRSPASGDEQTVDRSTRDDLLRWHRDLVHARTAAR